jgi:hypothetical protein
VTDARLERAAALLELGRPAQGRELCAAAVAADPADVDAWVLLSRCCFALDEFDACVHAAEQALAVDPRQAVALRQRALALIVRAEGGGPGKELRVDAARMAIEVDPEHWFGHALLARALRSGPGDGQRWESVWPSYQAALRARELAPDNAGAHFAVGLAAVAMRRSSEAEEAYRAALALDPQHVQARHNLAAVLHDRGQVKDVAAEFAVLAATEEKPGAGTENLRLFATDLLVRARDVSAGVFCCGLLVCSRSEFQTVGWRLAGVLLSLVAWSGWALWARRLVPRDLVGPLWRLARRTPSARAALCGLAGGTVVGLLLLCVSLPGIAQGILALVGLTVQIVGLTSARVLARRKGQDAA